ncbi:MAG: endo-1,4-beta-xylanase [Bacteroides sp.]|nr:endo-1,4-beta-xylanase [Bacteroides sp.]
MKKQLIFTALGAIFLASCADTWDREYSGVNPQKEGYEYLAEYLPLKEYVDRSKYPNFKLGIATSASEYTQQQLVYALINSNADETVAGNAMKMASCVDDKGNMSFDNAVAFVNAATDAGLNMYGHTLAWHAQQPVKYLNSLMADREIEIDPDATQTVVDAEFDYSTFSSYNYWGQGPAGSERTIKDGCFVSYNPSVIPNFWEFQYHVADGINWVAGVTYKVTMMIRASENCSFTVAAGTWGGQAGGTIDVTTEWQEVSVPRAPGVDGGGFVMFQSGNFAGTIEMKWLKVTHEEAMAISWWTPIISNGDAEGDDATNFVSTHVGGTNGACDIVDGAGVGGTRAFVVTSAGGGAQTWDTQFFLYANRTLADGDKVKMSFDYRADVANNSESQAHAAPGGYIHWDGGAAVNFTTDWQHFEKTIVISSTLSPEGNMQTWAWNLDVGAPNAPVNKYYFDNITLEIEESGNTIPLTPEEKRDTLIWAMDRWIGGMMQAMGGKVKAWDVVNEAISGGNADAEGVYALQHDNGDATNFFWQDYMGDLEYVRTAVASARKHFEANGGNPSELKLFVNDYNLESDWDQNAKLKSLIKWIERWEADGVTKIDGIGSQMHISCYANAATQESKKKAIVESFNLMAKTGRLVRISELDMGYVDANGNSVPTINLTEEQHKQMAELYTFVVSKYLELIPVAQQWGICQWAATDSPAAEGNWRSGQPIGLWDEGYNRKHTYAGFVEGLAGK